MRRLSTTGQQKRSERRVRPSIEGLESRQVLSQSPIAATTIAAVATNGQLSSDKQVFTYTAPGGTRVKVQMVGRGSLEGTSVDANGALHLEFGKTNAYSKIVSQVHGGNGQALLASIYSRDLVLHDAETSLSGIGASVIKMIDLPRFNLVAGGTIDVTSGIGALSLNSAGPASQIQLRELPETLEAGQSTTLPTSGSGGSSSLFVSDFFFVQSLTGITGEFISPGNILGVANPAKPGMPPAPPGIVLSINQVNGKIAEAPNLLTDSKIFGYDAATGQVVRFALDLQQGTGTPDMAFQVQAPGSTTPVGLSVGRDDNRLVLMVNVNSQVNVYDATYGTPLGSFTVPAGFDTLGSTDSVTVMGNVDTNQLQIIDVAASLAHGVATPTANNPAPYTPPGGFSLVGGLTGLVGTNQVYSTVAATFNTFQPNVTQLGFLSTSTSSASPGSEGGLVLQHQLSTTAQQAYKPGGSFIAVDPANNPNQIGVSLGSVDSSLALNTITVNPQSPGEYSNVITLLGPSSQSRKGTIRLNTTNPITDLSEAFRPELTGSPSQGTGPVLIDVQGNIQSLRTRGANGLVLNNTGYLNLVKANRLTNSTIVGQPVGHIQVANNQRRNTIIISSANREVNDRNGVVLVPGLNPIGPLSLTQDRPSA